MCLDEDKFNIMQVMYDKFFFLNEYKCYIIFFIIKPYKIKSVAGKGDCY